MKGFIIDREIKKQAKLHKRSVLKEWLDWKITDLSFKFFFCSKSRIIPKYGWKIEDIIRKTFKIKKRQY